MTDIKDTGITWIKGPDGRQIATHPDGDEYAAQVLSGEIPLEVARENERRSRRERRQFVKVLRTRSSNK